MGEGTWELTATATVGWAAYAVGPNGVPAKAAAAVDPIPGQTFDGLFIRLEDREGLCLTDNGFVIVEVRLEDPTRLFRPNIQRFYYRVDADCRLVPDTGASYQEAVISAAVPLDGALGHRSVGPQDSSLAHVAPWDNPMLSQEERAHAAAKSAQVDGTATARIGLGGGSAKARQSTATPPTDEAAEAGSVAGCESARDADGSWFLLVFGLGTLGFMLIRRRQVHARPWLIAVVGLIASAPVRPANAETRAAYGNLEYWDARTPKFNNAHANWQTCDVGNTNCHMTDTNVGCCYQGVPSLTMELIRVTSWNPFQYVVVASDQTNGWSWFFLEDQDYVPGATYYIRVTYSRTWWPGSITIGNSGGQPRHLWFTNIDFSAQWNYQFLQVNAPNDTTSINGAIASIWDTLYEASVFMQEDGESSFTHRYGNTMPEPILVTYENGLSTSYAACAARTIRVDADHGHARTDAVAHELGHHMHFGVVGCAGQHAAFPAWPSSAAPHHWWTGEGISLHESIPSFVSIATVWDPDTATSADIQGWLPCFADQYDSANRLSATRNNNLAFWEWLDTDTSNAGVEPDTVDITLGQAMDSLETLHLTSGAQGQNRTNAEAYFSLIPGSDCSDHANPPHAVPDACTGGSVCFSDFQCYGGDPHGENLRDWGHHLAADQAGLTEGDVWRTMAGSKCVGRGDNVYPLTGGYHVD